jgi:hypothetical protein
VIHEQWAPHAVCDPATRAVRRVNPRKAYYADKDDDRRSVYFAKEVSAEDAFESCITICRMSLNHQLSAAEESPCIGFALEKDEYNQSVCTPLYKKGRWTEQYPVDKGGAVYSIAQC